MDLSELTGAIYSLNPVTLLWVGGGVALTFVLLLAYDSFRRTRRRSRMTTRAGQHVPAASSGSGAFRNLRNLYRSVDAEVNRRRRHRHNARERERRK